VEPCQNAFQTIFSREFHGFTRIFVSSQFFGDKEHRPEGLSGSTRLSKKPSGRSPAFLRRYEVSLSKRQTFVLSLAPPARAGVVSFVVS
jgi:hypothetical protein